MVQPQMIKKKKNVTLTAALGRLTRFASLSRTDLEPEFAMGVTGNEHALLVEGEEKTLLRENDLEVEGFSVVMSDFGMFEKIRNVFSPS